MYTVYKRLMEQIVHHLKTVGVLTLVLATYFSPQSKGVECGAQGLRRQHFHVALKYGAAFALLRVSVLSTWRMALPATGVALTQAIGQLRGMGSCRSKERTRWVGFEPPNLGKVGGSSNVKLRKSQWKVQVWRAGAKKKVKDAAASGRPEPRPAEMDLYDVIVKNGFRNTPEKALSRLIAFLKGHGAPTLVAFAFWMLEQVGRFLGNSWQVWRGPTLQQHVLAFVRVCGCRETAKLWSWMGVDSFYKDAAAGWCPGRHSCGCPQWPLWWWVGPFYPHPWYVYGPASAPQRGPFSVLGFDSKKVVLLDSCFDEAVLTTATCCTKARLQSLSLSRKKHLGPIIALRAGGSFWARKVDEAFDALEDLFIHQATAAPGKREICCEPAQCSSAESG